MFHTSIRDPGKAETEILLSSLLAAHLLRAFF
jgi:hypothetical protein